VREGDGSGIEKQRVEIYPNGRIDLTVRDLTAPPSAPLFNGNARNSAWETGEKVEKSHRLV